jgi:predicted RNA-binding Zn ribbon-like protein
VPLRQTLGKRRVALPQGSCGSIRAALKTCSPPLAHSAAALLREVARSRLRKCAQCVLHFYDTSKKETRSWCSMQVCGNRLKVAAYAARQRASDEIQVMLSLP